MQIPKRKQILKYRDSSTNGKMTRTEEYIVQVLGVSHRVVSWKRKAGRVVCLARHVTLSGEGDKGFIPVPWVFRDRDPDKEWRMMFPYRLHAELIDKTQLPLYLSWEHGVAFNKVLKGEL